MKYYLGIIKENILQSIDEEGLELQAIFLFGSRAKGRGEELSDYDFLIVVKNKLEAYKKREMRKKLYNKLHQVLPAISFDIFVKSGEEFEAEKEIANTISNEVLLEGIRI